MTLTGNNVSKIMKTLAGLAVTTLPKEIEALPTNPACPSQATNLHHTNILAIILFAISFLAIVKILSKLVEYLHAYFTYQNLTIYNYKVTFWNLMFIDRSDIYVVLTSRSFHKTIPIYVGSYVGLPDYLVQKGYMRPENIWYKKTCIYNYIMFVWTNYSLTIGNKPVELPNHVQISMLTRLKIWYYFGKRPIVCQLVTVNNHTKKSQTLTSLSIIREHEPDYVPRPRVQLELQTVSTREQESDETL